MAALTVSNEAGVEVVPLGTGTVAEVMHHLPGEITGDDLMAFVAGRGVIAMAGVAVGGAEVLAMLHVELPGARSALEAGMAAGTVAERFAQRTAGNAGNVTALTIGNEPGVEVVPLGARPIAVIMAICLMALAASRSLIAVADGAVAGSKVIGVGLVQQTVRSVLEAGVTGGTFTERLAQRSTGNAGNVTALTIGNEPGVEVVALGARPIAVIMAVNRMALVAGRGVSAVAGIAVCGPEVVSVHLVQRAARSALEAGMAGTAFAERFPQRATRYAVGVAGFASSDGCGDQCGMKIVGRSPQTALKIVAGETVRHQELDDAINRGCLMTIEAGITRQCVVRAHDLSRRMTVGTQVGRQRPGRLGAHLPHQYHGSQC